MKRSHLFFPLDVETEAQSGKLNLTRLHSWKRVHFLEFHGKFIKIMLFIFIFSPLQCLAACRILVP